MSRPTIRFAAALCLALVLPTHLSAQVGAHPESDEVWAPAAGARGSGEGEAPATPIWATVGLGRGTHGAAALVSLNVASGAHFLSARATGDFGITTTPSQGDYGVLYGRTMRWPLGYAQASIGLAYVQNEFEDDRPDVVGIPVSVGGAITPLPVVGLGLQAFGNLNETESFGGVVLTVEVGLVP